MISNLQYLILLFLFCFVKINAASSLAEGISVQQLDSLIQKKIVDNDMTQLELLVLYQDALRESPKDSIEIFKNLAIYNADLGQSEDAFKFTEKYITNTLDFAVLENPAYNNIRDSSELKTLKNTYSLKINLLTFLFFYVALIGFSFTVFINLLRQAKTSTKFFISGFVGVHSLFVLEFVFYISNLRLKFPHVYLMASSVALWYGPFLYFYFKSLSHNFRFKALDLLHFVPNLILLIYLIPLYSMEASEKIKIMLRLDYNNIFTVRYVIFTSKVLSLAIYGFLIGRVYYSNKKSTHKTTNSLQTINKWKQNIYRIHVSYIFVYLLYGFSASGVLGISLNVLTYLMVAIMSIMIFYIAYMSYVQPGIFTENIKGGGDVFIAKYQKSGLTDSLSEELKENLIQLLSEDKLYKHNDINLEILSNKLDTTRHNTSQIINEHFKMNFFELINKFRIQEALSILESDIHGSLNIIDIAYEVGYNNKATFNKAFKKETSLTPTEFLQLQDKRRVKVNFE